MSRRALRFGRFLPGATMVLLTLAPAQALEVRLGETIVVEKDEVIEDDLYALGQTVTIHGTVHGDVTLHARKVTFDGSVQGDLGALSPSNARVVPLLVGLILLAAVRAVPVVGALVTVLVGLLGLGALVTVARDARA